MDKVLIVEDSKTFAIALQAQIEEQYGYQSVIAESLADTEKVLAERQDEFFVAIVDLHLPDSEQGEAIEATNGAKIPTIVFTGQINDALREDILSQKVADYVLKHGGQHNIDYVVKLVHRIWKNRSTKVLVVDDSRIARNQMKRMLEIQKYQVILAEDGESALKLLEENPDISICLLDCFMEGMDGFQLAGEIRAVHGIESMAIIGVSGQGGSNISAKFIKAGANDFIVKPFQHEEFFCRVNQNADYIEQFQAFKQVNEKKNKFFGMAAHDIRSPLGIIKTASDILVRGSHKPEQTEKYHEMIHRTSKEMLNLLNDLLDITAIESGRVDIDKMPTDLNTLVQERLDFFESEAERKSINIKSDLQDLTKISCDENRIRQVVDNLISNALKYSPLESTIEISLSNSNNQQRFEIIDQGPGIPEGSVDKLFGEFQQMGNRTTGGEKSTGLGLAICKRLIEAHQGKIGYEPSSPSGSKFYFSLPCD